MHAIHLNYHEVTQDPRVWKQCKALTDRGVEVSVVCALGTGKQENEQVDSISIRRIPWLSFENLSQQYLDEISEFPTAEKLTKDRLVPLYDCIGILGEIQKIAAERNCVLSPETTYRQFRGINRVLSKLRYQRKRNSLMRFIEKSLGNERLRPVQSKGKKFKLAVGNPQEALIAREDEAFQAAAFLFDLNVQTLKWDHQVDVVHAHDIYTLVAGVRLSKMLGAKLVYDAHEYEPGRASKLPPEGNGLTLAIESDCLERADALITVSPGIQDLYSKRFPKLPTTLVMNAPVINEKSPDEATLAAEKSAFRSKLNLAPDTPLLVFTGLVLDKQRGLPQVAEALTFLPGMHLVILGPRDSRHDPRLMRIAKKLKVADRIHMLPPVPHGDVVATIRACDVSIVSIQDAGLSYRYSMPNKLFEGVFAGLPAAVADLPDMRAFVEEHGVGKAMDATNPASIAQTVQTLYDNRASYRLTPEVFDAFIKEVSWDAQVDRLYGLYETLVPTDPTPDLDATK